MKNHDLALSDRDAALDRRLTVRLDKDRFGVLEQLARREGFSVSIIVRHLVYRYVEQQRRFEVRGGV